VPYLNQIYPIILTKGILQDTMNSKSKYEEKFNDSSMTIYRMKAQYNSVTLKLHKKDSITVTQFQKMSKQERR